MRKGFTLIELSVVLVIIGLLIGGILAAQSMINTAKIQAFVRQIGQFDIAVTTFKERYNSLPGDSNTFPCSSGTCNGNVSGDGNGYISDDDLHYNDMYGETQQFWQQLSLVGLKPETASLYSNDYHLGMIFTGATANMPEGKLGNNTAFIANGFPGGNNDFMVADCSAMKTTNSSINCSAGIEQMDAISVESKIDDGIANSGNVSAWQGQTIWIGYQYVAHSTSYDSTGLYSLDIKFGAVSGNE